MPRGSPFHRSQRIERLHTHHYFAHLLGITAHHRQRLLDVIRARLEDRLDQIDAALEGEVDIILLDNFTLPDLQKAQALINDRAVTEISGNVSLETIADYRAIGCDFISAGALVHKSVWVDIGLDWDYAL